MQKNDTKRTDELKTMRVSISVVIDTPTSTTADAFDLFHDREDGENVSINTADHLLVGPMDCAFGGCGQILPVMKIIDTMTSPTQLADIIEDKVGWSDNDDQSADDSGSVSDDLEMRECKAASTIAHANWLQDIKKRA